MTIREFLLKRKYYLASTILSFISGIIVGYCLLDVTDLSSVMTWIGGTVSFTWGVNMFVWAFMEIRQQQTDKRKKEEKIRKKLNDDVFKNWNKVSATPEMFHVETKIEKEIDPYLFEIAKEFLKDEDDHTREILRLWNRIDESLEDSLSSEYNKIGEKVVKRIIKSIHKEYSSLKAISKPTLVKYRDECYVTHNIIRFVEFSLKPKLLKNESVDWEKILAIETYENTEPKIFILACHGVCIQSKDESNVQKQRFQNMMQDLMQSILHKLKQLEGLQEKIDKNLKDFIEKMHRMSVDIDLPMD